MLNRPLIVITRPAATASNLINLCKNNNLDFIHLPIINLKPIVNLSDINLSIANTSVLFFVSPTAIDIAAKYINFNSLQAKLLVVGKSSAQALAKYTSKTIYYPNKTIGDSEQILKLSLWDCENKILTIIKGDNGRDLLKNELKLKGWQVNEIVVYIQKINVIPKELLDKLYLNNKKLIIIVTSTNIVNLLFNNIEQTYFDYFKNSYYISIHNRISSKLEEYGVKNIITTKLDNGLILQLIKKIGDYVYD